MTAFVAVFCFFIPSIYAFSCDELDEVDINSASQEELECLDGVGPTYSERIVNNRSFSSLDDLENVSGIGPVTVSNIKEQGLAVVGGEGDFEEEEEEKDEENENEETNEEEEGSNEDEDNEEEEVDDEEGSVRYISSHSSPVELSVMDEPTTVKISAGRDRLVSTESNVRFKAYIDDDENLPRRAEYEWVLGDGSVKKGREIEHRYFASGNYSVVLTVRTRKEEAVSRVEVEVVEPEVHIKSADKKIITLFNSGQKELNLGGWELSSGDEVFEVPENTIILPESSLNLPVQVTGVSVSEDDEIKLLSPEGGFKDSFAKKEDVSDNDTDQEEDSVSILRRENERLHSEVSLLREELSRSVSRQESDTSDVVSKAEKEEKKEARVSVLSEKEDSEEELKGPNERGGEKRKTEIIYDSSEEEKGLWKRLLGAPAAAFGRLPF
ncbi:MAG: helix-hairpin-helix domain-containing protein [Patescibacteria group bacterium]